MNYQSDYNLQPNEDIFRIIIQESPTPVGLYVGKEMVIRVANKFMLTTWGKGSDVINKKYRDILPELEGQNIFEPLDDVFTSGKAYHSTEYPIDLVVDGLLQNFYFNFDFTPLKDKDGNVWGVLNTATDVTELVLTRKQLAAADERVRFALESSELGTWDLNPINKTVTWDERCRELFGFGRDTEVSYDEGLNCIHPDDIDYVSSQVMLSVDIGIKKPFDIKFRTIGIDDNKTRWVRSKGRAYFNDEGLCHRFAGTIQDITREIADNIEQQKLLRLIDNSSDFIGLSDPDGVVTFINMAGLKMLGLDNFKDAYRPNTDYVFPGEVFKLKSEVYPAVAEKGFWTGEITYRHFKTGEAIPTFVNTMTVFDPVSGESQGRATIVRDLRQEISSKQALTDQIKQYEFVTNFMPVQLWTAGTDGLLDFVNQRTADFFGMPAENIIGPAWQNFVHPDDFEACIEVWTRSLQTGDLYQFEFRLKDRYGEYKWHLARALPFISDGKIVKWFGTNTDIDEQKRMERQKDDFLGIASHELKTPVTSIKAYAQVLGAMLSKEGEKKKAEMVLKLDSQVNRLTNLIGDLLDVTKINSGRLQFNKTWFDFNEAIKESVEDLQHTTTKHQLIQDFTKTGKVYSDKDRIGQVLTNLVTNAVKYSPHSDKIIISTKLENNEVTVCVQDFGIGIPGDKADRVFEQFYRVSGDKQHTFPGLGLGLYISSEIIKREGGRMWVNSIEGKGSTFCFTLPVDDLRTKKK
jgi:PAS domain S-box-containing protein